MRPEEENRCSPPAPACSRRPPAGGVREEETVPLPCQSARPRNGSSRPMHCGRVASRARIHCRSRWVEYSVDKSVSRLHSCSSPGQPRPTSPRPAPPVFATVAARAGNAAYRRALRQRAPDGTRTGRGRLRWSLSSRLPNRPSPSQTSQCPYAQHTRLRPPAPRYAG